MILLPGAALPLINTGTFLIDTDRSGVILSRVMGLMGDAAATIDASNKMRAT